MGGVAPSRVHGYTIFGQLKHTGVHLALLCSGIDLVSF